MWLLEDASAQSKVQTRPFGEVNSTDFIQQYIKAGKERGRKREVWAMVFFKPSQSQFSSPTLRTGKGGTFGCP